MKGKLIAAAGALATAATIIAMATPASAGEEVECDLSVADNTHTLGIYSTGVYAGRRNAKACKTADHSWGHSTWSSDKDHDSHDDTTTNWGGSTNWGSSGGTWGNNGGNNGSSRGWGGYGWPGSLFGLGR